MTNFPFKFDLRRSPPVESRLTRPWLYSTFRNSTPRTFWGCSRTGARGSRGSGTCHGKLPWQRPILSYQPHKKKKSFVVSRSTCPPYPPRKQLWSCSLWRCVAPQPPRVATSLPLATCRPSMMILLLLFLQKQSLAFAVYLFGIGTLHTGPGLK
jgi:hypothetical protein